MQAAAPLRQGKAGSDIAYAVTAGTFRETALRSKILRPEVLYGKIRGAIVAREREGGAGGGRQRRVRIIFKDDATGRRPRTGMP